MNKNLNEQILKCREALINHGVIAFPTETVMGLGIIYNDEIAFNKINKVKNRPENKPYTVMVSEISKISEFAFYGEKVKKVMEKFMPGSLTILLKAKKDLPFFVTRGLPTVGVRIPSNVEALELLRCINQPLLVPSANRSGESPALSSKEVKNIFGDELDFIMEGKSISNTPSTIIDFSSDTPKLIRQGAITFEEVMKIYE